MITVAASLPYYACSSTYDDECTVDAKLRDIYFILPIVVHAILY